MATPLRIKSVHIEGFRCITDVTLDLTDPATGEAAPFVAIVGPNGSGKTALLEGVVHVILGNLGLGTRDVPPKAEIVMSGGVLNWPPPLNLPPETRSSLMLHTLYQPAFRDPLIPGRQIRPGLPQRIGPDLALSGDSLHTADRADHIYQWLMARQISRDRIPELWAAVEPFLGGFSFFDLDPHTFEPRFQRDTTTVTFSQLSGGQRTMVFSFAEILMQCGDSGLLLIDEPEQHIHPEWQRKLPAALQKLMPHGQVIVATHSPFLVHGLAPHQVFVLGPVDGEEA